MCIMIFSDLCKRHLTLGFGSCGTVRLNCVGLPLTFKKLKQGKIVTFRDRPLTDVRWMNKYQSLLCQPLMMTQRQPSLGGHVELYGVV